MCECLSGGGLVGVGVCARVCACVCVCVHVRACVCVHEWVGGCESVTVRKRE